MRVLAVLLFIATVFVSCQTETPLTEGEYEITGTMLNAAGQPIYLDQLAFSGNNTLDTAIIANDGSFTLKGKLPAKSVYSLRVAPNNIWLLETAGGKMSLKADLQNPYEGTYTGTPTSQALNDFRGEYMKLQEEQGKLQQALMQAQFQGGGDPQQLQQMQIQYNQNMMTLQNSIKNFVDTVSSPLSAMFAFSMSQNQSDLELFGSIAQKLQTYAPESPLTQEFMNSYNQQLAQKKQGERVAVGQVAPTFSMKTPTGESLALGDLEGEVILLDFWASWCRPCRMENPNLVRTYNKYKNKGFNIYSISLDKNMQKWVAAIEQDNLTWDAHGSELKGWSCSVANTYNVRSIPATFLLDKEGKIIATNLRGGALESKLAEIFGS